MALQEIKYFYEKKQTKNNKDFEENNEMRYGL